MADTSLFEVARQTHEEAERTQAALVEILLSASTTSTHSLTHKEKLKTSHKASVLLDRITSRYQFLDDFYRDEAGEKIRELQALDSAPLASSSSKTNPTASSSSIDDALGQFYNRLDRLKQYHQKYPSAVPDAFVVDFDTIESKREPAAAEMDSAGLDFIDNMFSGEEMAGRFLDLYVHHDRFLNLKAVKRCTYLTYIEHFDTLAGEQSKVPNEAKKTQEYKEYVTELRKYLSNFLRKTQPLANVDEVESKTLEKFEQEWENGQVAGWEEKGEQVFGHGGNGKVKPTDDTAGIWCEACRRSYSKQTVYDAHLKSPKHLKAAARLASSSNGETHHGTLQANEAETSKKQAKAKILAREEALISALGGQLESLRADTKANVERKAALTDRERQAEADAAEEELNRMASTNSGNGVLDGQGGADEDEEQDGKIYNPLRLPLGWDGRPIPYWLYKLHGLGVEFKCEICSDHVYQGRKNFERHFQESRHAFGMRALGLPNTVHFRDVTTIQDALTLSERLRRKGKVQVEQDVDAEEVEDEHGNTYSKKTYELLKRQGLI